MKYHLFVVISCAALGSNCVLADSSFHDVGGNLQMVAPSSSSMSMHGADRTATPSNTFVVPAGAIQIPAGTPGLPNGGYLIPKAAMQGNPPKGAIIIPPGVSGLPQGGYLIPKPATTGQTGLQPQPPIAPAAPTAPESKVAPAGVNNNSGY